MRALVFSFFAVAASAASCVVDESFDEAQFLCDPSGGYGECPDGLRCAVDGRCRKSLSGSGGSGGIGGKDGGGDGSCFPTTCDTLAPKCGDLDDGCGNQLTCGCQAPFTCGGGAKPGECGCSKKQSRTRSADAVFEAKVTGSVAWASVGEAALSDDKWATAALDAGKTTNQLKASAFGFALPANAVVKGVEVSLERSAQGSASALTDKDVRVLVKGAPLATNGAKSTAWPTTDATAKYGSATELWGATAITLAEVQAADFGVLLTVAASAAATARVDAISLTVHYEDPACPN